MILSQLGTVLNIRTLHPITGMHQDSRVSIRLKIANMHLKITKIFLSKKNWASSQTIPIQKWCGLIILYPLCQRKKATLKDSFFQNVFEARDCFASRMKKREEKEKVKKCWSFARKRFLFFKC